MVLPVIISHKLLPLMRFYPNRFLAYWACNPRGADSVWLR